MKKTILYVEDEVDDVFFMKAAFKRAGVPVELASVGDGQKAIAYLAGEGVFADREKHPLPEAMLLDLNLPVQSGFEVLGWLRQQPQFKELTVVVFSSSGRPDDRRRAQELGATDYVLKPSSGVDFVEVARRFNERWLTDKGAIGAV